MLTQEERTEGSIVATYRYPGCTVYINDAAYIGKTEEELEHVREEARRIAKEIMRKHLRKKQQKEEVYGKTLQGHKKSSETAWNTSEDNESTHEYT